MMTNIKFKMGELEKLRQVLLKDLSKEAFAILLAKKEYVDNIAIYTVVDILLPTKADYKGQGLTHLKLEENFIEKVLIEATNRYDVDTIIDVHTHPFCKGHVSFSGIDDNDEKIFFKWINKNFDNINYLSIVFSQSSYSARVWKMNKKSVIYSKNAEIKTQLTYESIPSSDFKTKKSDIDNNVYNRGILALGLENMRKIADNQVITIIGAGGTGSVIAESLVHMGFNTINLIDHDRLEVSNMNRVVGAYYQDAVDNKTKVEVIARHIKNINSSINVHSYFNDVYDKEVEKVIATSDWIIMATDNHSSRHHAQELAFKYFIPFISLGVNITVEDGVITDESGEIITVRMGDRICLNCLKRINPISIAYERNIDGKAEELVKKGYVSGKDIKEPAVKTLNSILGQMTVDILVNQYTQRLKHQPLVVYERNKTAVIYEDKQSLEHRNLSCSTCDI